MMRLNVLPAFTDLETREICALDDSALPVALEHGAILPRRARPGDAGLDLYPVPGEPPTLRAGEVAVFNTGVRLAIPWSHVGKIEGRSGMASRAIVPLGYVDFDLWPSVPAILGGVIDASFRGTVGVILANLSPTHWAANPGTPIAQLVVYPIALLTPDPDRSLDVTERGSGGFGHTDRGISSYSL
jgi:dUTP pyrophosphatase